MSETSAEVVKRYLHDTLAGEKSSEMLLDSLAGESASKSAKQIASRCAQLNRRHQEQLANRLESLGGNASDSKSLLGRILERRADPRDTTHRAIGRTIQDLIETFAISHSAVAFCEALATMAEAAGDSDTAALVRSLQSEKQVMAQQLAAAVRIVALERPLIP